MIFLYKLEYFEDIVVKLYYCLMNTYRGFDNKPIYNQYSYYIEME